MRAGDRLLALTLSAEAELARELATVTLGPLDGMAPAARSRAESTLRAWLDAHGDVSRAAEVLHVHPQTVRQRLAALRAAFGPALDEPLARLDIAVSLRARDLLE